MCWWPTYLHAGDFASLYQKPREPHEETLFGPGLKASNIWYGHELSVCWMQPELPPGFTFDPGLAQSYDESGWCFVEAAISAGVKVGKRRLDLSKRTRDAMGHAYGGDWNRNYMLEDVCAAARLPPLLPDDVRRLLTTEKKFTASADLDKVDQLYRTFFDGVTLAATQLNMQGLGWTETQVEQLVAVLPRFTALTWLDLSHNKLGVKGAKIFAPAIAVNASIMSIDLSANHLGPEGAKALAPAIRDSPSVTG